ncbi:MULTISPECIES: TetR/AcrR family transcriptional regulator [Actinomadura]|uniref:TetR family transcriptional regulator n=1 Tax=Actinomadura yumaensis TaxID=111807 RepID=A0ABW2CSE2_9ACTN|nr:TetR/AcrR family transcriptional regulator [Actinomadura sp. J1-007]MWK35167.1 TetR family transcriptional regulator [Actinomadura sp. J1-007]
MARPRTTSDEAVLAAAARAIGAHGTAALTLAKVAEEAGLSPATLVQRFGSKRGLLLAVARTAEGAAASAFERARAAHGSPLAALLAALDSFAAPVRTPEEMANHLGFLQLDLTDPEFRDLARAQARRIHGEIARLVGEAERDGELAEGLTARSVQVAYNGALITWAIDGSGTLADALRAALTQLIDPYRANGRHP